MPTCRDVIRLAARKLGAIAAGTDLSPEEGEDYLVNLQSLYREWIAAGAFGVLRDRIAAADMTACPGERIRSSGFTITLPLTVTHCGRTRTTPDLSLVCVTAAGSEPAYSLFDADLDEWVSLTGLELSDEAPLASRGIDGLAACLARRLAWEANQPVDPQADATAGRFMAALRNKRLSTRTEHEYF